jgi:hypothetical protein
LGNSEGEECRQGFDRADNNFVMRVFDRFGNWTSDAKFHGNPLTGPLFVELTHDGKIAF